MRKLGLSVLIVLFVASCSKKSDEINPVENNNQQIKVQKLNLLKKESGILSFNSVADYEATINELENQYENWNENFEKQWEHLSDEEYADKQEELNFDEFSPLKDFGKQTGIKNLLTKIEEENERWLNNEELDFDADPEKNYPFEDDFMKALLNDKQEIIIGTSIFFGKNNEFYEIPNKNFEVLENIRNNQPLKDSTLIRNKTKMLMGSCRSWAQRGEVQQVGNNRRYKMIVALRSYFFWTTALTRVVNYERIRGRWRTRPTSLKVRVAGQVRSGGRCDISSQFLSRLKERNRRRRLAIRYTGDAAFMFVKVDKNDIVGYGFVQGILNQNLPLTW